MSGKEKANATVTVLNEIGLHARPASLFVQKAAKYKSHIHIIRDNVQINAKSIMGVLGAGIGQGTQIVIEAEGEDAQEAVLALVKLIEDRFGEDI